MATRRWIARVGPLTLVVAILLYGFTGVVAVYIGTIAELPAGAILGLALFGIATYALRLLFHRHKPRDLDDDEVEA